jgi:hypothetical protein
LAEQLESFTVGTTKPERPHAPARPALHKPETFRNDDISALREAPFMFNTLDIFFDSDKCYYLSFKLEAASP